MKAYRMSFVAVIFIALLAFEARATGQSTLIKHILQSTQQRYAPDRRTAVFYISYKQTKTGIVLFGEVDALAAKNALIDALHMNLKEEVVDSIRVLPDQTLGNYRNGIVIIDVGDIRHEPRKQGELVTQVLMGAVVKLLKKAGGYYFIQMPDQYLGWIDSASLSMTDQTDVKTWNTARKVIITELKCIIRKTPDSSSVPLCNVVAGCILKSGGKNNGWTMVELADGRKGFVLDSFVQDLDEWNKSRMLTGENLEKTAKALLGIPYLWGGTSVKGMDCSGFVKMVYRLNGMELHRDADQQADQGTPIDPGKNFENLQKGDILFFGRQARGKQSKRITHVGLSIGNRLFIHSSGRVRLSSLDPSSTYFEESLLNRFVRARRIIPK
jgi:Cell wall-associated hydrolases (invasion-associated proteins)